MKKLILIFVIGLIFASCKTCPELITSSVVSTKTDSSWTKTTVIHDTSYVVVEGPTITLPSPCASLCDSLGRLKSFHQESKKNGLISTITTNTVTNTLESNCKADSLMQVNTTLIQENNRLIRENKEIKETVMLPCPKDHRTGFDKICRWLFWLIVGAVGGIALWKFGPKLLGLIKSIPKV